MLLLIESTHHETLRRNGTFDAVLLFPAGQMRSLKACAHDF